MLELSKHSKCLSTYIGFLQVLNIFVQARQALRTFSSLDPQNEYHKYMTLTLYFSHIGTFHYFYLKLIHVLILLIIDCNSSLPVHKMSLFISEFGLSGSFCVRNFTFALVLI